MKAVVTVPASSANLGPGFDAFGLALKMHARFEAEVADSWSVNVLGEGAGRLPSGPSNAVARAMKSVFDACGFRGAARIVCENGIPVRKGLGSSAAAAVGGVLLANELAACGMTAEEVLSHAVRAEGHGDNAAAALLGGFVVAWHEADIWSAQRFEPAGGVAVLAAVSEAELATERARRALPRSVPHEDAAFNAGRAALFALGMLTGDAGLVAAGAADRLHERYRVPLIADAEETRAALLDAGAAAAVLSGSGPTIVGIFIAADDDSALARARAAAVAVSTLPGRRALAIGLDRLGAVVERVA